MGKQSNNRHDTVTIESRDLELINVQNKVVLVACSQFKLYTKPINWNGCPGHVTNK